MTPFEFLSRFSASENYSPGLSCGVVCVILRLAVSVERRLVIDGRTDRQIDAGRQLIPALASVARAKTGSPSVTLTLLLRNCATVADSGF